MMRKGFFLLAVLVAVGAAEASAQEVTARIAGLEGNAEYMEMLREEASLQAREDSVTMVVNRVRRQLRDDPAQRAVYSAEILRCEEQLFSIRTERGRLTDRINTVEPGLGAGESRLEQSVDDDGRPCGGYSPARFVADGRSGA